MHDTTITITRQLTDQRALNHTRIDTWMASADVGQDPHADAAVPASVARGLFLP
jgi:hypothetical protein